MYKRVTKKIHRKRDKTCHDTLKKGESLPLFYDSRSIPIYITIYTDAISLVIRACTNGWKKIYISPKRAVHRTTWRKNITCKFQRPKQKKKRCLTCTYTAWSIARYVYWADVTIWWLRATNFWKLESTLVHRITWRLL